MVESYGGTLLDHLADHLIYLSTATSFWYSLDSIYDHEFHLSKRLGISPQDYECLLVAAQLAILTIRPQDQIMTTVRTIEDREQLLN
jgi:hypothetical protein